eukprot:32983-Amorphochlora_amoeboformis.AAC.3
MRYHFFFFPPFCEPKGNEGLAAAAEKIFSVPPPPELAEPEDEGAGTRLAWTRVTFALRFSLFFLDLSAWEGGWRWRAWVCFLRLRRRAWVVVKDVKTREC